MQKSEGRNGRRCGRNFRLRWWSQKCSEIDRAAKVAGLAALISRRGLQCCTPRIARSQASRRKEEGVGDSGSDKGELQLCIQVSIRLARESRHDALHRCPTPSRRPRHFRGQSFRQDYSRPVIDNITTFATAVFSVSIAKPRPDECSNEEITGRISVRMAHLIYSVLWTRAV
jgi:hypothetical protein